MKGKKQMKKIMYLPQEVCCAEITIERTTLKEKVQGGGIAVLALAIWYFTR